MVKLLNNLLMMSFFIVLYMALKKYNKKVSNNPDIDDDDNMIKYVVNEHLRVPLKTVQDTPYQINFDYEISKDNKLITQFQKEQDEGVNTTIKYPNRFIVKLDENEEPIWSDYKNLTGNPDNFIDNRILFGDNLYGSHIKNMDGKLNPKDANMDNTGMTLKKIYDNHILDFKDLIPKKEMAYDDNKHSAASNLQYMDDDDWKYKNERGMNGGVIYNNIYAADPTLHNTPALYE